MPQLTFTRFIAAFFIVVFHFGHNLSFLNFPFLTSALSLSPAGVSYFFLLSGFILTWVYNKGDDERIDKKHFFLARFARIYPVYILALLILLVLLLLTKQKIYPLALLLQITLLQAWFPNLVLKLNIPAWSLSVEVFFYLLFPFLLVALRRIKQNWLLIIVGLSFWFYSLLFYYYGLNIFSKTPPDFFFCFFNYNPLFHLNSFILGIISCLLFKRLKKPLSSFQSATLIVVPFLIVIALIINHNPILHYFNDGLLAPLFAVFLIGLAGNTSGITTVLAWRPLVLLGEISYGIYILQVPVAAWFNAAYRHLQVDNYFWQFLIFFAALIFIAWVSLKFVERPARVYLKKRLNKK
jgi:Predicted acyltransferases